MPGVRIIDVTDESAFRLLPPCADPTFDHRTCDYWENAATGSKLHRPGWLEASSTLRPTANEAVPYNPFLARTEPSVPVFNPFALGADDAPADNPFAPASRPRRDDAADLPRKLALLDRGRAIFGSYAKVLLLDDQPAAYVQFGPLSAYPRASRLRDLYPQLPESPLPAVITCIASTREARGQGHARRLVEAACEDLAGRGFSAVEAYPDLTRAEDDTSAARPCFWERLGFAVAVPDERYPVMRREL